MAQSRQRDQTKSPALELFVDPSSRRGIARSLYQQLRDAIASGRVSAGDRLPPTRELAAQIGVSRQTVTTVYEQLVGEGFIAGRAGGGTYVNPTHPLARPGRAGRSGTAGVEPATGPVLGHSTAVSAPPRFDLRAGAPDHRLFPTAVWRRCSTSALEQPPGGYGDPAGRAELRDTLADWVSRSRGLHAGADQILVTAGAQQAIDLILRVHVRPGDIVAIEEPGYAPVRALCETIGATVRPAPVDADGIVVDHLPAGARLIYTTPAHQFPTGAVMGLQRRLALLDHAARHDALIIEDDYDSEYRHVARPLEPLQRLDRHDRVLYVDTFSKTLAPALRLGFAVVPRAAVAALVGLRRLSDWQPAEPQQTALNRFIADGHLGRHLRRTRKIYTERHGMLTGFLEHAVERGLLEQFTPTCAGLHIMARCVAGVDEREVVRAAAAAGVAVTALAQYWQQAVSPPPGLVIGFGSINTDDLPTALAVLAGVLQQHGR